MDRLFRNVPFVRAYMDDVVVFSVTLEEHVKHVTLVLKRDLGQSLNIKLEKCPFGMCKVVLLGHIVDALVIGSDPDKINRLVHVESPSSGTELRSLLVFAGYYCRFIEEFEIISVVQCFDVEESCFPMER